MPAFISFTLILILSASAAAKDCLDSTKSTLEKGNLFRQEKQFVLALQNYQLVAEFSCKEEEKAQANLGAAQTLYKLNDNSAAEKFLEQIKEPNIQSKAKLLKAWYTPEARGKLSPTEQKFFTDYTINETKIRQEKKLKQPWIAGVSSALLPGLGQVYNGNLQSAALSFVLNSLFLATALELDRKDMKTSALAAGVIFSITYSGNILGSIDSAQTINQKNAEPFLEEERKRMIPGLEL